MSKYQSIFSTLYLKFHAMNHNYIKFLFLVTVILILPTLVFSQNTNNLWEKISPLNVDRQELMMRKSEPIKADFYSLNFLVINHFIEYV